MRLYLPQDKCDRVVRKCSEAVLRPHMSVRKLAELIGTLISAVPATKYGLLYTKQLEQEKAAALEKSGNWNETLILSEDAILDLNWWISNIPGSFSCLHQPDPDCIITTDASPTGWGAWIEASDIKTYGFWSGASRDFHINVKELWAIFYGVKSLVHSEKIHLLIRTDSSTALAYVNKFGGCRSTGAHDVAKKLWQWAESREIILSANYINTKDNFIADKLSRMPETFGMPEIDLFASHNTTQCSRFYSFKPDPSGEGVDAFAFRWTDNFFAFPPFNLVARVINKIRRDKCKGILVVPDWKTQPWYPLFKRFAVTPILRMSPNKNLLFNPSCREEKQVNSKLAVLVAVLSGRS